MVVPHQDIKALIDDRGVFELLVDVTGGDGRDCGVEGRGVAQPGVEVSGGVRTRHAAGGAGALDEAPLDLGGVAFFFRPHFAGGVDLGPGDMAVHVNPAGHDDHPRGVEDILFIGGRKRNKLPLSTSRR